MIEFMKEMENKGLGAFKEEKEGQGPKEEEQEDFSDMEDFKNTKA